MLADKLGMTLPQLWGISSPKGDFGLEFECEGTLIPFACPGWIVKEDHSLRGGYEWITDKPYPINQLSILLTNFFSFANTNNCLFNDSIRTSIHVHINATKFKLIELYNILTAYYLLEPLLVKYSGPTREGNLFCLRLQDADYTLECLITGLQTETTLSTVNGDNFKYAALNLSALYKYGSLEFRSMRGDYHSQEFIEGWVKGLYHLCQTAASFKNPKEIIQLYKNSPYREDFLHKFLPTGLATAIISQFGQYLPLMDDTFHYSFALATAIPDWTVNIPETPFKKRKGLTKQPIFTNTDSMWDYQPPSFVTFVSLDTSIPES